MEILALLQERISRVNQRLMNESHVASSKDQRVNQRLSHAVITCGSTSGYQMKVYRLLQEVVGSTSESGNVTPFPVRTNETKVIN